MLHGTVKLINATELYTKKMVKMEIDTTIKNNK